jgi:GNAT superfamily N-acetyltransferase
LEPVAGTFELETLNSLSAALFHNLTFRAYQYVLYQLQSDGTTAGIGAFVSGHAAGLILGEVINGKGTIISVAVDKAYRNHGIGSALLCAMEKELAARGASTLALTYVTGKPTTAALVRVLEKCVWPKPEPKHLVCTSDKRMYDAPWMANYTLPPEFEVVPWVELTAADREALERSQQTEGWIPEGLSPFDYEGSLEPANSLGIRFKGEIVGWLITQPREPDAVCYSCSYLRPDLQKRARLVAVYAEGVRRQVAFTTKPIGIWIVPFKHKQMANFVLRRMRPWLISLAEFHESKKSLGQWATAAAAGGMDKELSF